jgi:hypothetical protein
MSKNKSFRSYLEKDSLKEEYRYFGNEIQYRESTDSEWRTLSKEEILFLKEENGKKGKTFREHLEIEKPSLINGDKPTFRKFGDKIQYREGDAKSWKTIKEAESPPVIIKENYQTLNLRINGKILEYSKDNLSWNKLYDLDELSQELQESIKISFEENEALIEKTSKENKEEIILELNKRQTELIEKKTKEIIDSLPEVKDGKDGKDGAQGERGLRGLKGNKGDIGPKGEKGDTGPQGEKGDTGPQGKRGLKGTKGDTGPKGEKGDTGPKGEKGDIGPKGEKGDIGPKGEKGDTGPKGEKGDVGPQGPPGKIILKEGEETKIIEGPKGEKGDTGPKGEKGDIGPKGEKGDTGPKGEKGDIGPKGDKGENGLNGDIGPKGDKVELRAEESILQWKYENEDEWKNLFDLEKISPKVKNNLKDKIIDLAKTTDNEQTPIFGGYSAGIPIAGAPGRSVEMRVYNGFFQWRREGESWIDLVPVGGGSGGGYIYITDVTNIGNIGNKIWEDTIPPETVLTQCSSDTDNVTIHFLAEGGEFYNPTVNIGEVTCTNLQQTSTDKRLFFGSIPYTLTQESEEVFVNSSTGAMDSVLINKAGAGPQITNITFGPYPGVQTHLKQGDNISVEVTIENEASSCWIESYGASVDFTNLTLGALDSAGEGYRFATGVITISNTTNNHGVIAQGNNSLGTLGNSFESDVLFIDQNYPQINFNSITYPIGQQALKNSETAELDVDVLDFTSVLYSSPNNNLDIPNNDIYEMVKTITRINGDYNITNDNYRIVANKESNGSQTTFNYVVKIANAPASVDISTPYDRLRSEADYNILFVTTQEVLDFDILNASIGTWSSALSGNGDTFQRNLNISDSDPKGTGIFSGVTMTNLAGIVSSTIDSGETYEVGGFISRTLTLPAFENEVFVNTTIVDYSKVTLEWSVKDLPYKRPVGTTATPDAGAWSLEAIGVNPSRFIILDTAATDASSQESIVVVEEMV